MDSFIAQNLTNFRFEQAKLASVVAEAQEIFHIGLKYFPHEQTFKWVNGEEVTYTNWGINQPGRVLNDSCFFILTVPLIFD